MSILSKLPWKIIGGFVPVIAEIVKQANDYAGNGEKSETEDLKKRVAELEAEKVKIAVSFRFVLVSGIVILLISVAGLTMGIIALAK